MTAWVLGIAAAIAALTGVVHSWLGEWKILRPLLAPERRSGILQASEFIRATVRFAWHLTSIAWLGSAAILWTISRAPLDAAASHVLVILGGVYMISAAVMLLSSRGRHLAWPLFLLIALAAWGSVVAASGPDAVRTVTTALGLGAGTVLVALAAAHAYWAIGGRRMKRAAIPEREGKPLIVPSRFGTALIALALLAAAVLVVSRIGLAGLPLPAAVAEIGCWLLAATFILRAIGEFRFVGFFKRVTGSSFARWDSALYSPLCLLLGIAIAAISARAG